MTDQTSTIPKGWKMTTLGDVAEVIGGGTPKTDVSEYWGGKIPWLSVVDFNNDNRWVYKTEKTITDQGLKNSSTTLLNAGDLIVSARGTVGAFAQLKSPMAFNQSCYGLRAKENSENNFLYYLLKSSIQQIKRNVHGAVFDTITRDTFDQIVVEVPPLPEQRAITAVLSSLDDKIELLRKQNKTLEATAQAIFKEWFVNFNFPNATGKMIDSRLGEIPERWRIGKLGDILSNIESGSRPKGGIDSTLKEGIPSVGAESIDGIGNYNFSNTKYVTKEFFELMKRGLVDDYDVLIYKDGAYVGKKAMFGLGFPFDTFAVNEHVFILRTNKISNQFFLYFILKQEELSQLNTNSAQPGLNQEAMKNLRILIPTVDLVDKFGRVANVLIDKILINSKQIQTLTTLRDALLPKLMKGEIRVEGV